MVNSGVLIRLAVWGGIGLLAVVALVVAVFVLRKTLLGGGEPSPSGGLDLATLIDMRDRGTLSETEFRKLSARVARQSFSRRGTH